MKRIAAVILDRLVADSSRRRACRHKHRFASAGAAEAAIRSLMKRDGWDGRPMEAYFCVACNHYHFGHTRRRK